jgi:hypothetical protein
MSWSAKYRRNGYDTSVADSLRGPNLPAQQDPFVEHAAYVQSRDPLATGPTRLMLDTFKTVASPFDAQHDILFYFHEPLPSRKNRWMHQKMTPSQFVYSFEPAICVGQVKLDIAPSELDVPSTAPDRQALRRSLLSDPIPTVQREPLPNDSHTTRHERTERTIPSRRVVQNPKIVGRCRDGAPQSIALEARKRSFPICLPVRKFGTKASCLFYR